VAQSGGSSFSVIGGHAALDLVNTRPMGPDGVTDKLVEFHDVVAWARSSDLISAAAARAVRHGDGESAIHDVRQLREALRAALETASKGPAQTGTAHWRTLVAQLNAILKRHPVVETLKITDTGEFAMSRHRPVATPEDVTWVIARQIADFLADGTWRRARACNGSDCVLWFVDRTRNRSRHWCRMESCGSRAKAKAYYQRKKAR